MQRWFLLSLLSLSPVVAMAAPMPFACNMRAMTPAERTQHAALSHQLLRGVQEKRELPNGYALRLSPDQWLPAARWSALERNCCPFFAFGLACDANGGPVWLRITGAPGAKAFLREEFGL